MVVIRQVWKSMFLTSQGSSRINTIKVKIKLVLNCLEPWPLYTLKQREKFKIVDAHVYVRDKMLLLCNLSIVILLACD